MCEKNFFNIFPASFLQLTLPSMQSIYQKPKIQFYRLLVACQYLSTQQSDLMHSFQATKLQSSIPLLLLTPCTCRPLKNLYNIYKKLSQASYMIVDEMHEEHPELLKDQYWEEVVPKDLPYTGRLKFTPWATYYINLYKFSQLHLSIIAEMNRRDQLRCIK